MCAVIFIGCNNNEHIKFDDEQLNEFIENYNPDIEFSDDKVLVVLTDEASEHINDYTVNYFSQIQPAKIEILAPRYIFITLSQTGREYVLRAVYILNKRSDIKFADPDIINSPDV